MYLPQYIYKGTVEPDHSSEPVLTNERTRIKKNLNRMMGHS